MPLSLPFSRLFALALLLPLVAGCAQVVETPEQPLAVNLTMGLDDDVRTKVDQALDQAFLADPATFGSVGEPEEDADTGERADGLIGSISNGLGEDDSAVNDRRLAVYTDIASQTGASVPAVQARAGTKLIAAAPAGRWVLTLSNQWSRKP